MSLACLSSLQLQVVPDVGFLDVLASQCLTKLAGFTAEQLATNLPFTTYCHSLFRLPYC
jgi:hypothetical protein